MRTGRGFAVNPRSANQISPGLMFIKGIEDFLHNGPRRQQVQRVSVSQLDHVSDDLLHLSGYLWPPGCEFFVELLGQLGHAVTVSRFYRSRNAESLQICNASERLMF